MTADDSNKPGDRPRRVWEDAGGAVAHHDQRACALPRQVGHGQHDQHDHHDQLDHHDEEDENDRGEEGVDNMMYQMFLYFKCDFV